MPLTNPLRAVLITALSVLLMLSGCGASDSDRAAAPAAETDALVIPSLSFDDARRCSDPGVPAGEDARSIIASHRVALGECRRRHARVVKQYEGLKTVLAGTQGAAETEGM